MWRRRNEKLNKKKKKNKEEECEEVVYFIDLIDHVENLQKLYCVYNRTNSKQWNIYHNVKSYKYWIAMARHSGQ